MPQKKVTPWIIFKQKDYNKVLSDTVHASGKIYNTYKIGALGVRIGHKIEGRPYISITDLGGNKTPPIPLNFQNPKKVIYNQIIAYLSATIAKSLSITPPKHDKEIESALKEQAENQLISNIEENRNLHTIPVHYKCLYEEDIAGQDLLITPLPAPGLTVKIHETVKSLSKWKEKQTEDKK